jgi:hypothetical protein
MIAEVNCGNRAPRVVTKGHAWVINLMNYVVKPVPLTKGRELKLSSPNSILLYVSQILIDRLIILYEGREIVLISFDMRHRFLSILFVQFFVALKLVSNCSEKAVPIASHFNNF